MSGIRTPVKITQLKKFEKQNRDYSVNVYALDSSKEKSRDNKVILFPLYNTKERNRKYHANLLLVTSGDKRHYVVVKNLNRLLRGRTGDTGGNNSFVCRYCLYSFKHEDTMKEHEISCSEHAAVTAEYPAEPTNILKFKNYGHTLETPFVIYADFEAILEEVDDDENKSTRKINKHVPCGFARLTTSSCEKYNKEEVVVYSGRDCMSKFFQHIHSEQLRINKILNEIVPMKELTPQQIRDYRNAKKCYICDEEFSADQDDKNRAENRDHNHLDGLYIGPACARCNLSRKYKQATRPKKNKPATYEIPIFFHNLRGYDSHILLEHFPELTSKDRVNCIATNFEQFLTFSYRGLKFVYSYQFLKASLSVLAENLKKSGNEKFVHTKRHFDEHFEMVTRKGVYCYSYMTSFEKFDETELPPIECFYNDLSESHITQTEYQHAQDVWKAFDMTTMKQYHDMYLATDVLILSDVMTEFSRECMRDYGLDPKHYVSLPGFSWDALFYQTKANVELLTDPEMHLFIESSIRGGVASISARHALANNPYLPPEHYDPSKEHSYVIYTDANNLYGLALSRPLPISNFKFLSEQEIEQLDIMNVPRDGDTGFFFSEVDLGYPKYLHRDHNSMPLAPENIVITRDMLSEVTIEMGEKFDSKFLPQRKLCPNLMDKTKYVLHFVNLQFYINHGMVLRKIHRVLSFTQSPWIEPYITFNTEKRKAIHRQFQQGSVQAAFKFGEYISNSNNSSIDNLFVD